MSDTSTKRVEYVAVTAEYNAKAWGLRPGIVDLLRALAAERDALKDKLAEANHYLESSAAECYSLNAVNERLTAERDALRAALQGLVNDLDDYPAVARLLDTYEYARAALGERQ